jgi:hypothetical protein
MLFSTDRSCPVGEACQPWNTNGEQESAMIAKGYAE